MSDFDENSSLVFGGFRLDLASQMPPGSRNTYFNETPDTDPLTENPVTGVALPDPVVPAQTPPPQPVQTPLSLEVTVRDGIRIIGGDLPLLSSGVLSPERVESGDGGNGVWISPQAAASRDGSVATCAVGEGSSTVLKASGFSVPLPEGARVVGVKVTVRRSKI